MKNRLTLLLACFLDHTGERTSWRAITAALTTIGKIHVPDKAEELVVYGVTAYGIFGAVFSDDIAHFMVDTESIREGGNRTLDLKMEAVGRKVAQAGRLEAVFWK